MWIAPPNQIPIPPQKKTTNWNKQKRKQQKKYILQNQPTLRNTTQMCFLRVKILLHETSWHQRDSYVTIKKNNKFTQEPLLFAIPSIKHWNYLSIFCQSKKIREMWFMMQLCNQSVCSKKNMYQYFKMFSPTAGKTTIHWSFLIVNNFTERKLHFSLSCCKIWCYTCKSVWICPVLLVSIYGILTSSLS